MLCNSNQSVLKKHQLEISNKENSLINNSRITKLEDYINKKTQSDSIRAFKISISQRN